MKITNLKTALLAFAAFVASVASAQTYTGTITESDYTQGSWAPDISYSITYQSDKHLLVECTFSESQVGLVPQLNLSGDYLNLTQVEGTTYKLTTSATYEAGTELNNAYFWLAYSGGVSRANFKYVVGASNTETDTEAPAWVSDPVAIAKSVTATITMTATDNSSSLTYEASAAEDFSTIAATATGASGKEVTLSLNGLTAATDYTYYVRVKDAAGNVSEVKTVTFTTTDKAAVVATFYGVFYSTDWEEKASVNGKDVTPKISWKAETLEGYGDVIVTAKLGEALPDGAALKYCANIEGIGEVGNKDMTKVSDTEYTIQLSDVLASGTVLTKDQIFGQFFFRIYPKEGGMSRTKILAAVYKVGASNDPVSEDTTAPTWNAAPMVQNITDKTAEIVVNLTDDSGNAAVTITGDNGFTETVKTVVADGSNQVISLTGLTAETTYNLTLAVKDGTGNVGESKNLSFTTAETPNLDVLYLTIPIVSTDWNNESFNPNGTMYVTVNPDNTLSFKAVLDQDRDDFAETNMYVHGVQEPVTMTRTSEGVYECTTTNSISDRTALVHFHMYYVFNGGASTFAVKNFTPSNGSTSAVAEVEAEAVNVVAADGVIRVDGRQFAVYTLAGQQVYNGAGEARLDRGVYVVVVEGKAVKVML